MIPIRHVFKSRWVALAWAGSICLTAYQFAGDTGSDMVDAARSPDNHAAQASALLAEDDD